ncbi:MAG: hypothetical protein ACD_68C00131G0004 [uncultured bacterium]|nr:MAG: hypothetical protein ACD_68C00131G0004 [uncultured bacterium]
MKKKNQSRSITGKRILYIVVIFVTLGLCAIGLFYSEHSKVKNRVSVSSATAAENGTAEIPTDTDTSGKIPIQVQQQYFLNKLPAQYWLVGFPTDYHDLQEKLIAKGEELTRKCEEALQKFRDLSPQAKEIASTFPKLGNAFFNGVTTVQLTTSLTGLRASQTQLQVCWTPQFWHNRMPASMYYERAFHAVLACGFDWPELALQSVFLHEAGHALCHHQNEMSAFAPPGSDLYIDEEIVMHELEALAVNQATSGKYFALVSEIAARADDWKQAISSIILDDLKKLDELYQAQGASQEVADLISSQLIIIVGFKSVEKQIPTNDASTLQNAKREVYRQITSQYS